MGSIEPADWNAVQECARAVEKLHIANPDLRDGIGIANSTYFQLGQLQGNTIFFPALRSLRLSTDKFQATAPLFHLPLFLSPTLTSITISHFGEDAAGSLARFLAVNGSGPLTNLTLHSFVLSPFLAASISQCLSLEILDLKVRGPLKYSSLKNVLSPPLLSDVKLKTKNAQYTQATDAISDPHAGDIGQIHLDGQITMIEDVITATGNRNMRGLAITLGGYHDQETIQNLLQHIAAQQPSIMNLAIKLANTFVIDASFLVSLISANTFHELRTLEFRQLAFQQLDQHLPQMLSHWQHIQHLSFGIAAGANVPKYISLASLKLVAQSCPNLSLLEAPFDSPGDIFDAPGGISTCFLSHKLLKLSLIAFDSSRVNRNHQPISDVIAQRIARYIYALFPDLDEIETHECRSHSDDFWRPVAESYKLFQSFCRREFKELNDMRQCQLDGAGG